MKFGLMYANAGPFAFPEMLTHLAQTAERVGWTRVWKEREELAKTAAAASAMTSATPRK